MNNLFEIFGGGGHNEVFRDRVSSLLEGTFLDPAHTKGSVIDSAEKDNLDSFCKNNSILEGSLEMQCVGLVRDILAEIEENPDSDNVESLISQLTFNLDKASEQGVSQSGHEFKKAA